MDRNISNVMAAFLLGAAAGGITALLLAPASGPETRKKITDTLRKGKNKVFAGVGEVKGLAGAQKNALKEAVIKGKEAYQKARERSSAEAAT
jgi:gas vesicle protein